MQSQHGRPTKITLVPVALPVHLVDAYRLSVSLAGCVADGATTRRADIRWSGAAMIGGQARIDGGLDHQVEVLALRRAAARSSSDSTGTGPMSARVRASAKARAARVRRSNCSASLILERGSSVSVTPSARAGAPACTNDTRWRAWRHGGLLCGHPARARRYRSRCWGRAAYR